MGAGAHGAIPELPLDDLEPFGDLLGIRAGAIPSEQELADVCGNGVLALELEGEVLPDDEAVERLGRDLVELVQLVHVSAPTSMTSWPTTVPLASSTTANTVVPMRSSSSTRSLPDPSASSTSTACATEDAGSPAFRRRSIDAPEGAPETDATARRPRHRTVIETVADAAAGPALARITRSGVTHSCGLSPPCS